MLGLVVPRELASVRTPNRRNIRAAGRRWPERVKVLDWVRYSSGHASWFAGDGLHLAAGGRAGVHAAAVHGLRLGGRRDGQRHLDARSGAGRAEESLSAPDCRPGHHAGPTR